MSGRAVEFGYMAGWRVIRALPKGVAWSIFRTAADRAARRPGPGTQRLAQNLRRVIGSEVPDAEFDRLVREALRSYARYWLEVFRLPSLSRAEIVSSFRLERAHLLGDAVAAGTGCVVALPHAGNWDAAGAWVCAQGWGVTTVAERLKPEGLFRRFVAFRESLGMEIVPLVGGQRPPLDVLADRVRESRVVPLLADRDLTSRGVDVRFFGGRTRMPAGPALLTLRTGAPLFTCSLWYEGDLPVGRIDGPLPVPPPESGGLDARVRTLTQTVADRLAEGIARHPVDWHMLQRMWLAEPAPEAGTEPSPEAVSADP